MKYTLFAAAAVACMAGGASAATVSYTSTFTEQSTDFMDEIVAGIQQFDTSLGTLNSATVSLVGTVSGSIDYESRDNLASSVNLTLSAQVALKSTGLGDIVVTLPTFSETRSVTAYDGTTDFGGTSGGSVSGVSGSATDSAVLTGADLAEFVGTGTVSLFLDADGLSTATGPGNLATIFSTFAGGQITVVYDYTETPAAVPLPAGAPLLLLGLGALGVVRARKKA